MDIMGITIVIFCMYGKTNIYNVCFQYNTKYSKSPDEFDSGTKNI